MAVEKDVVHSDDVNVDPGSARRSEKGLLARDELVRNESKRPDVFGKRGERVGTAEEVFRGRIVRASTDESFYANFLRLTEVG